LLNELNQLEPSLLHPLKLFISGGDVLKGPYVDKLHGVGKVYNAYGPTEATIGATYYLCKDQEGLDSSAAIPIGKPISNYQVYILDRYQQPVPVGLRGELCIAGAGVARGYLNRPELTVEKFVPDPFKETGKLYRTGDLAKWLEDGNIQFCGRIDQQVKIRGFRIELGEIENLLLKHQKVKEAVVIARGHEPEWGAKREDYYLCAYIVREAGVEISHLKEYLARELPDYMVPAHIVPLPELPLSLSGKIDRKKLPLPKIETALKYHAPENETEKRLVAIWQELLHLEHVGIHDNFFEIGGNSLYIIRLANKLKEVFGREIPVVKLFQNPTITTLAKYLAAEGSEAKATDRPARGGLSGEVAVIGMAARFPGARNIDELWENLKNGVESITFLADEELEEGGITRELLDDPDYVKAKGILEDVDCFDAAFFDYTPKQAGLMNPQIRFMHECCWEALEDAGYNPATYPGLIGLYAGATDNFFWLAANTPSFGNFSEQYELVNLNSSSFTTLISYKLDLKGTALTVQTACSTSLVAVDTAYQGLLNGRCDMALAGGVTITFPHKNGYVYQEGMILSADGHCRPFSEKAQGTLGGNGVGIVILKPLENALTDGDHIYAVIKGSATNNDGLRKVGYTAPSVDGQVEVIRSAHRLAGITAESIGYIEAHGTGTPMGDPIEIEALTQAFNTPKRHFCKIGSIKSNVGHLDNAAGIAGFIKAALMLTHKHIPPSLHVDTPNPKIDFENSPFSVSTKLTRWESRQYPLRAGVSSFGIGGTNAHVVLEEAPKSKSHLTIEKEFNLLLLSAKTPAALERMTGNLADYFSRKPHADIASVAYTLQRGRNAFTHRRMLAVSNVKEAMEALSAPEPTYFTSFVSMDNTPVLFMFPGQGSQYENMGLDLYRSEPLFREEMDRCFEMLTPSMGYDLREVLYNNPGNNEGQPHQIDHTEVAQPLLFVFEYALSKLLMSWGIKPKGMIGHSIGEYVAAHLAGVFSLEDALAIVSLRGKLMQGLPGGTMLSIPLAREELLPLMNRELSLAAVNSPANCVASGSYEAVDTFANMLKDKGYDSRKLHTSHAFHSPMMEPILKTVERELRRMTLNKPTIPFISNVTGNWITAAEAEDPVYWTSHLRNTVLFFDGIGELLEMEEENAVLLEVGAGKTLSTFARQHPARKPGHAIINLVRHPREQVPDHHFLLDKIGRLWLQGVKIDWQSFYPAGTGRRVSLPTYPFESQRFNIDVSLQRFGAGLAAEKEPLKKRPDIGDWLYVPSWKRTAVLAYNKGSLPMHESWLVFTDGNGFGDRLVNRLLEEQLEVVTVREGKTFARKNDSEFIVNPREANDYSALLSELKANKKTPAKIIYLWTAAGTDKKESHTARIEKDLELGLYSLLDLTAAIGTHEISHPVEMVVISNTMQEVTGEEEVYPAKAVLQGPVKVIPQEYTNIDCRSIDILLHGPGSRQEAKLIEYLLAEFTGQSAQEAVAYRGNYRWIQTFAPLGQTQLEQPLERLKQKGVYLVTGGLGGMGLVLAKYLAEHWQARLVLTDLTAFPDEKDWPEWLSGHSESDVISRKIRKIMTLNQSQGDVLVCYADVSNPAHMQEVFNRAKARFGNIDGIIHAAGIPGGGLIQSRKRETSQAVLAPKVQGTLILDEILKEKHIRPDFFVLCSSLSSILAPAGQVAYASANAFLDSFATRRTAGGEGFTVAINWDTWQEVGMAVDSVRQLENTRPVRHPLFHRCIIESPEKEIYVCHFSAANHWVLDEHRLMDKAMLPGTAYLEIVRAVFEPHTQDNPVEIEEIYFLTPLVLEDGEEKEVRIILEKQEERFEFIIISRSNSRNSFDAGQWQEHARGKLAVVEKELPVTRDIGEFEQLWTPAPPFEPAKRPTRTNPLVFGPRWNNRIRTAYRANEAIAELELPTPYHKDIDSYKLHPALMDTATSFHLERLEEEEVYAPFYYKNVRIKAPLPHKVYSYVAYPESKNPDKNALEFSVSIMDEKGVEVASIEKYIVVKVAEKQIMSTAGKSSASQAATAKMSSKETDILGNGILPEEGVEVFKRIINGMMPQVVVSTLDLATLVEESRLSSGLPEVPGETGSPAKVYQRPDLSTPYVEARDEIEQKLVDIFKESIGIEKVGIKDDFFELGGDSLKLISISSNIHKALNKKIQVAEFFNRPTVQLLGEYIKGSSKEDIYDSIKPVAEQRGYAVSSAQKRLYSLFRVSPDNTAYNLPAVMIIEGNLDEARFESAFQALIQRHETLRTSFHLEGSEPIQVIHTGVDFQIKYTDAGENDIESLSERFIRPFDLGRAPLIRVEIVRRGKDKYTWLFDLHHIIADATGYAILQKDLVRLYNGEKLPPLRLQYKDFSSWQKEMLNSERIKEQEAYWLNALAGDLPRLDLPTDFPRPTVFNFEGDLYKFHLDTAETPAFKKVGASIGATLFMNLLAVFKILLSQYSGHNDIIVGCSTAGRPHADLQEIAGMFANILPIRDQLEEELPYIRFLEKVKQSALDAFANQDIQLDMIVDRLNLKRNTSRDPLLEVCMTLENYEQPEFDVEGMKITPVEFPNKGSKFDLTLWANEKGDTLSFYLEYSTELFKKSTMEKFANRFIEIIEQVIMNKDVKLEDIKLSHQLLKSKLDMPDMDFGF
jgi:acyl transferase domain-containing protein